MSFAFVFPGQGSQIGGHARATCRRRAPGPGNLRRSFGRAWLRPVEAVPGGPEEVLGTTERTQPAMLAAGVATWRVWRKHGGGCRPRWQATASANIRRWLLRCAGFPDRGRSGAVSRSGDAGGGAGRAGRDGRDPGPRRRRRRSGVPRGRAGRSRAGRELQFAGAGRDRGHRGCGRSRNRSRARARARSARSSCRSACLRTAR